MTPLSGSDLQILAADFEQENVEFRDFLENVSVALHALREDGTILWANAAEMKLLGYPREEYIGRNITEFHADSDFITGILNRLKKGEKLDGYEARLRCRDGSIRYVSINSSVYRRNGRFAYTRCVTIDITERKKDHDVDQRLAAIVESSDDAVIEKDLNGTILTWNRGAERIFGYTSEEAVSQNISLIVPPARMDEIPAIMGRIARGERIDHYETKRRTKARDILTVSLTVSPIRDSAGKVIAALMVLRDATVQDANSDLRERMAAIVESSDDAIISKDLDGSIRSWNRGAQRLFGYTAEEIMGKHISTLAASDRVDEIPVILDRIRRGERVDHYETKRKTKDGKILTVSLTVSPIRDATGAVIGASKVARDITERHRQEQALREANEALTRSNADLQMFAYSASHDLQEPLRMVSTYSELLLREFGDKLGADGAEFIGYTLQGAWRMERLLNDLRDYALVSSSNQEPAEYVEADVVLQKALENLASAMKGTGASVTTTPLPRVRLHEFQLEQLFQNLVGNAIRYRSSSPPDIRISAVPHDDGWLFSVEDNGIGIDPQYKEQVFDLFKRLHSVGQYPGTGMGLAICKRIVERAGGRIWVESELGLGSTFFFTLPR
jgi:PAS domain S-box-containing protein